MHVRFINRRGDRTLTLRSRDKFLTDTVKSDAGPSVCDHFKMRIPAQITKIVQINSADLLSAIGYAHSSSIMKDSRRRPQRLLKYSAVKKIFYL